MGLFCFVCLEAFEEFAVVFHFFFLLAFKSWKCPHGFWGPWLLLQMAEEHWCCALVDNKSLECGSHSLMKQKHVNFQPHSFSLLHGASSPSTSGPIPSSLALVSRRRKNTVLINMSSCNLVFKKGQHSVACLMFLLRFMVSSFLQAFMLDFI